MTEPQVTRRLCVLLMALRFGSAQAVPSERAVDPAVEQAIALYKQGRIPDAATALGALHERIPGDAHIAALLAECWIRLGRYGDAVSALKEISETGNSTALYLRALALTRDKRIEAGRETIDRLLKNEDTPEVRLMVAEIETDGGDFDAAIANVARVIRENPHLPEAHYWRARDLFAAGEALGAEQAVREELVTSPNSFEANLLMGRILRTCHRGAEALPFLRKAADSQPPSEAAFVELAEATTDTAHPEEALSLLDETARRGGSSAELHRALARAYAALGRESDTQRERQLAAQRDDNAQAEELHEQLLAKLGSLGKAVTVH
jgi:predicted Zn-dependent protease